MIYLITGTPGAGKTLYAVSKINEILKIKDKTYMGRPIYSNINGLGFHEVNALSDDDRLSFDWRKFPDGSIFFIDEAQNYPVFASSSSEKNPILTELTVHRHRNFDFYFITQSPIFLHKILCKLAEQHFHIQRMFRNTRSYIYSWAGYRLDPTCKTSKDCSEQRTPFNYPKELYTKYKSASSHTSIKSYIPEFIKSRFLFILILLGLCVYLFFTPNAQKYFNPKGYANQQKNKPLTSNNSSSVAPSANTNNSNVNTTNSSAVAVNFIYDYQKPFMNNYTEHKYQPVELPRFSGAVVMGDKCIAYTQQGTVAKLSKSDCLKVANGDIPFNPFKQNNQQANNYSKNELSSGNKLSLE